MQFFTENETKVLNFIKKYKNTKIVKIILNNKNTVELSKFFILRAIVKKQRYTDQWSGVKDPDLSLHTYGDQIFNKKAKSTLEKIVSSTNGTGQTRWLYVKKN